MTNSSENKLQNSAASKIDFLDSKIRELDKVIQDLESREDLQTFGDYAERLRELEERKQAKMQAAVKRYQFQQDALQAEYKAQLHALLSDSLTNVGEVQHVFGKRRGMIKVDSFLENLKQSQLQAATDGIGASQDEEAAQPSRSNWLEDDIYRINSMSNRGSPQMA